MDNGSRGGPSIQLVTERAVVLGCGIAGLAAAAALRPHFDDVLIVERDRLPDQPTSRSGVPQGEQLHNLLSRAQHELDRLIPGFTDALVAAGAGRAGVAAQTHVFELGVRMPERDLGMSLMCASRPLIEHTTRRLLLESGGVSIREGTRAIGLEVDGDSVTGVWLQDDDASSTVSASIVVDATGTSSRAPRWLQALGRMPPPVELIDVAQWYVSTRFRRPDEWRDRDDFWLTFPTPPGTRGALVSPSGPDEWYVSVSGRAGDPRPATVEEVRAHLASLEDPAIGELIAAAEPTSTPSLFRRPTARLRRFERLPRPLTGLLPLGDSLASLNPLFGQGMSVAAWQAGVLADLLTARPPSLATLTSVYLSRAADAAATALQLGSAIDDVLVADAGADSHARADALAAFAATLDDDPELHRRYVRVWHLLEPASSLRPQTDGAVI
ncbi:MAG: FAD-dependent monooxygenase [Solirubrobacteraceae bacterium]